MTTRIEETINLADKFRERINDLKAIAEAFRHGDILVRNYNKFLSDIKTMIDAGDESTYTKQDFDDLLDMRNELFQPIMENLSFIQGFERYNPAIPVIVPEIDPLTEILGEKYYDEVNGVYTYHVIQRVVILENEKQRLLTTLNYQCESLMALVNKVKLFTNNEPDLALYTTIKDFYSITKSEINNLTIDDVLQYQINNTVYEYITSQLNTLL